MDRSFQSSFGPSQKVKFGSRKSFLGSGKKADRYSLSTKSNVSNYSQLQIVAKSDSHIAETFGLPLPVQLNESLTFSDKNSTVSVSWSEQNGYAWAVCGRKLLVWQYKSLNSNLENSRTPQRRNVASQCRILTLPHSDIGHKASLITVFTPEGHTACLAVSPTGDVRFWPSIAHDGSSIDENGIMEGQEFDELVSADSQGYLLITTTCHLIALQIQVQNGRQTILHRIIKPPGGFLGGIGKKFASIIIGRQDDKESKLVKLSVEAAGVSKWTVSILADRWFQRWSFSGTSEQFLFEDAEVLKKIRDSFCRTVWNNRNINEIELWLLDMQTQNDVVIIMVGATNRTHTPEMLYALVTFNTAGGQCLDIERFQLLKHKNYFTPDTESECLSLKFVYSREIAYVYNEKMVFLVSDKDAEKIDFPTDRILSASCQGHLPLFFSRLHGFLTIGSPSDFDVDSFNFSAMSESDIGDGEKFSPSITNAGNLNMYELNPDEIYEENKDAVNKLKAALIYHIKRNSEKCQDVLRDLLASESLAKMAVDSTLDRTVITLAQDLADDTPLADPRWENVRQKYSIGSSSSMQIVQQLREKSLAMSHFIEFLQATKIWDKLHAITDAGNVKSTGQVLLDIWEKMVAAIALKCIHSRHQRVIDEAIGLVVKAGPNQPHGNLTNQDIFYVQVTRFQAFFSALLQTIESCAANESQVQGVILEVNKIMLSVLSEVAKFRETKSDIIRLPETNEYMPWTSVSGKSGLRDVLLQLIQTTHQFAQQTGEPEIRQRFFSQSTELIDFVLDGQRRYLDSIKDAEKVTVLRQQYESQRSDLIHPLIGGEQYELAAKLGEKYLDFQSLVMICDVTNNQERLNEYIERFKAENFSQFAISWHMRQNKQKHLFDRFKNNQVALGKFLSDHPGLAWVQLIFNGELGKAAEVLFGLAELEKELVARKRTMLSLSKLSALASEVDTSQLIENINSALTLIDHQEQLPAELLTDVYGYDINCMKVLEVEELIALYVSPDNSFASEAEFRKALELLAYVDEDDVDDVRHKIWCAAILRDSWTNCHTDETATEFIAGTMFFKLIDMCYFLDGNLDMLPPIEHFLRASELTAITNNQAFQYLLKLGYEQIEYGK